MTDAVHHDDEINDYCLLFLATAVAGAICTFAYKFPFDVYGQKVVYEVRKSVFGKLMRLPVSYYDKKENTPGGVATKLASDAYQLNIGCLCSYVHELFDCNNIFDFRIH